MSCCYCGEDYCNNKSSSFHLYLLQCEHCTINLCGLLDCILLSNHHVIHVLLIQKNQNWHSPGALIHKLWLPLPNPMYHYVLTLPDLLLIDTATSTACPKPSHFGKLPITANTECIFICLHVHCASECKMTVNCSVPRAETRQHGP